MTISLPEGLDLSRPFALCLLPVAEPTRTIDVAVDDQLLREWLFDDAAKGGEWQAQARVCDAWQPLNHLGDWLVVGVALPGSFAHSEITAVFVASVLEGALTPYLSARLDALFGGLTTPVDTVTLKSLWSQEVTND